MEDVLNIPGSIHSISQEGNAVYANEVFDKRKNKKQQLVNQETDDALEAQNQRVATLEEAVGEGGSVDERIAQAKSETESDIKGGASSDYDTLKKTEDAIKAEVNAREGAVSDEASARQDAINTAKTDIIGGASTDCNTLGKAEIKISTNAQDIAQLQAAYEALTQSTPVIVEPTDTWPVASPEEGVIYRVIDRVNTPPQNYSDYMYNGTAMVLMATYNNAIDDIPTPGSNNLVKSGGVASHIVYDISEANAVGSTLATYADLAAALGNNGANIPPSIQKGGMSVKFVQSSDNKYVQYFLTKDEWSSSESDWEKMNLEKEVSQLDQKATVNHIPNYTDLGYTLSLSDLPIVGSLRADGSIDITYTSHRCSDFLPLDNIDMLSYYRTNPSNGVLLYDKNFSVLASLGWDSGQTFVDLTQYPTAKYYRVCAYSSAFSVSVSFNNEATKRTRIYYPFLFIKGKYVTPSSGVLYDHTDYGIFSFKVKGGITYTFPQYYSGNNVGYAFYNKIGNYIIGGTLSGSYGDLISLIAPEYATELKVSCKVECRQLFSVTYDLSTLLVNSVVTPSKTDFIPIAENVNLITGWESGYIDADGIPQSDDTLYRTTAVLMSSDKSYYIRSTINGLCAFYDIYGNVLASYANGEGPLGTQPYSPPAGTYYGRFTIPNSTYKERAFISIVDRKCSYFTREISPEISLFGGAYCNYNGREASVFNKGIAIGDSLTQGVFNHNEGGTEEYLVDTKYSWPAVFAKISGVQMTNKGIGGYSSVQWWENKGSEDLSGHDFAVVSFGVNDVSQLGSFTAAVQMAYTNIINKLKLDNPGIKIFVSTVFPAIAYDSVALSVTFCEDLRAFVAGLADDNVILLDLQKYGHTRDYVPYNAGHLSALGYSTLASDIYSLISYIIKSDKSNFDNVQFIGTNYSYT